MRRTVALAVAVVAVQVVMGCRMADRARSERRHAADMLPAALQPTSTEGGAIGRLRVRVYADDDYRAQNPDHQAKIRLLMERASRLLEPTIGARLEVVQIRPWQRTGSDRQTLQDSLEQLEGLDPGHDVDLVVGMTSALSRLTLDLHELGRARLLGQHLVVRGLNDATEVRAFEQTFRTLSRQQRQSLYSRRKRHKEQVILLHEVAHALGGLHVTGERDILNPRYDHKIVSFARSNAMLMRAVARARLARGPGAAEREWARALDFLRRNTSLRWNEDERAQLVSLIGGLAQGGQEDESPGETLGASVRAADRERFRAAERLYGAGRGHDAWEELEPLIDFYPDEPAINRLACRVATAAQRDKSAVAARCARALEVDPDDPEPHLRMSQLHLEAKEQGKALAAAGRALELLERAPADARTEKLSTDLATHLQALGAVSWAEKAAAKTKRGTEIAQWARLTRARYGLAPGGPVPPAREGEYVKGVRDFLTAVYDRKFPEAEKRAAALERSFRGAAGIHAARCDLEIRRRRYPAARAQCREALRRYRDASWAHYLTGLLDKHDNRPAAAAQHFERSIALDPELQHAYQMAAEIYAQLGRAADKKRIAEAFRSKFGRDLQ
jgi:tetratricopeptide (TPR) repeat protein